MVNQYDVVVIGAGPAGYSAAIKCAEFGLNVALVEKNKIGGVCLNVGCIPTKALIHNAEQTYNMLHTAGIEDPNWFSDDQEVIDELHSASNDIVKGVEFLLKKAGVQTLVGNAEIVDAHTVAVDGQNVTTNYIIIAVGSSNKPADKFLADPSCADKLFDSTKALFSPSTDFSSVAIIGGGAIGVEFAYIYNCFCKDVTLFEYQPTLLPNMDAECGKTLERSFKKRDINVITGATVSKIDFSDNRVQITYTRRGLTDTIEVSRVLVAMGRQPNKLVGLENVLPDYDGGYIQTNDLMQTSVDNIYAIGDIRQGLPQLAHVGYDEARVAAENIAVKCGKLDKSDFVINKNLIPFGVYCQPQVAGFGLTEEQAKQLPNVKIKKLSMKANGKSVALRMTDGFVKIIADEQDKILGAWIVGDSATEIIHELLVCASLGGTTKQLADLMHAHPTVSELISDVANIK